MRSLLFLSLSLQLILQTTKKFYTEIFFCLFYFCFVLLPFKNVCLFFFFIWNRIDKFTRTWYTKCMRNRSTPTTLNTNSNNHNHSNNYNRTKLRNGKKERRNYWKQATKGHIIGLKVKKKKNLIRIHCVSSCRKKESIWFNF